MNEKVCGISGVHFGISEFAATFYRAQGLPLPTLSADERARRRLAWRNERTLYRRKCDATGQTIVSIFDSGTPFPVFSQQYWWSDSWDPLSYGRDFDFSRPFFEQFLELFNAVPQCALRCPQSDNSEYTNQCEKNKDCYLVFCSNGCRECLYGMWYQGCEDCIDCTYLEGSNLCYEILNGKNCYQCSNSENLQNCSNCHFSRDLIGCKNCIGCINLRNKEYYLNNQKLSKDAWEKAVRELQLNRRSGRAAFSIQFELFAADFPRKYYAGKSNENFSGDYLEGNKNTFSSFNCRASENIEHCRDAWSARNCIDLTETLDQDFCIELEGCYKNVNSGFSAKISQTHDSWYCSHCFNSMNLFGCVGIKQRQYCILNKLYAKADYEALREKIIAHMRNTGEWGQYFPPEHSPFAYNISVAHEYFPLSKEQALSKGLKWKDEDQHELESVNVQAPDSIIGINDDILDKVFVCQKSGKSFKLQKAELTFYRKMDLPIPNLHHDIRHTQRMDRRNPRHLWERVCDSCDCQLNSSFAPEHKGDVLCETCFREAVA